MRHAQHTCSWTRGAADAARLLVHLVEPERLVDVEALQQIGRALVHLGRPERDVLVARHLDLASRARLQRCVQLDRAAAPQQLLKLVDRDEPRLVLVPRVEQLVQLRLAHREPQLLHPAPELLLLDLARAVVVPLAEELDHAHRLG